MALLLLIVGMMGAACDDGIEHRAARTSDGDVHRIDWRNRTYRLTCSRVIDATLRDGTWTGKPDRTGYAATVDAFDVHFGDVTGDKVDDAVVSVSCSRSGTSVIPNVFVYMVERRRVRQAGQTLHDFFKAASNGELVLEVLLYKADDARCCPSQVRLDRYKLKGHRWKVISRNEVPAG